MRPGVPGALRVAVTAALAAALVAGADAVPDGVDVAPAASSATPEVDASAPATEVSVFCPGPELSGVEGAPDIALAGSVAATSAPPGALSTKPPAGAGSLTVGPVAKPVAETGARAAVVTAGFSGAGAVAVDGTGALAPGVAAGQEWRADRKDLRGLVTTACAAPSAQSWLLGGGAAPGRQERLVLVNPGANEVTAELTVHGRTGVVSPPATPQVVVPARGRSVVLIDAVAGSEASPVVHVVVAGGTVAAYLSDVWLDGSVPAGAETTGAAAEPATVQVVPAVVLDGTATVRVAVPGPTQAVVSARLIGPKGALALPGGGVQRVPAGAVRDLVLKGVPAGRYAVEVRSDVPVVAAVQTAVRDGSGPGDFAWSPASPPLSAAAGASFAGLPKGAAVARTLDLVASGGPATAQVLWVSGGRNRVKKVELAADTSRALALGAPGSVWVSRVGGNGALRAAVDSASGAPDGRLVSVSALTEPVLTTTVSAAVAVP